jgi:hypothetical protein
LTRRTPAEDSGVPVAPIGPGGHNARRCQTHAGTSSARPAASGHLRLPSAPSAGRAFRSGSRTLPIRDRRCSGGARRSTSPDRRGAPSGSSPSRRTLPLARLPRVPEPLALASTTCPRPRRRASPPGRPSREWRNHRLQDRLKRHPHPRPRRTADRWAGQRRPPQRPRPRLLPRLRRERGRPEKSRRPRPRPSGRAARRRALLPRAPPQALLPRVLPLGPHRQLRRPARRPRRRRRSRRPPSRHHPPRRRPCHRRSVSRHFRRR